jgi:hypothetical protein
MTPATVLMIFLDEEEDAGLPTGLEQHGDDVTYHGDDVDPHGG